MEKYSLDYSKWKHIAEQEKAEEEDEIWRSEKEHPGQTITLQDVYAKEIGQQKPMDKLQQLKIKMAVEAYESRRPPDTIMHHYWIKEAGDPDAIGEYFPSESERNGAPVYYNQNGLVMSREAHASGVSGEHTYSWVIGSLPDRRPLYGVRSDDLSVPTLGWQAFTAPEPVPVIRYYTKTAAARTFKERGNRAFQRRDWKDAESWYTQALNCGMDASEYAEPYAMLLSNRSETRMKLQQFRGAADDADDALKHIKTLGPLLVGPDGEPTRQLRQKSVLRLARALQAMGRMSEAMRLLHHERRNYPDCPEVHRLAEATKLALRSVGRGTPSQSQGEQATLGMNSEEGKRVMSYVAMISEDLQKQVANLKVRDGLGDFTLPADVMEILSKFEYVLIKAQSIEGDCFESLQTLLRTNGVLRCLLQVVLAQWQTSLDGRFVDMFKLPGLSAVANVFALLCDNCPENLRVAADEAHCFLAMLSGCNCKVEQVLCERLICMVASIWDHYKPQVVEVAQLHSIVVERSAFYLSQAVLVEDSVNPVAGPDSPVLSSSSQEQAALLLLEFIAQGGRIKKRALRGLMPELVGQPGRSRGFLSAQQPAVRTLGELVARSAVDDPHLVSAEDVTQLLQAVQQRIQEGPVAATPEDQRTVIKDPSGETMTFVDLAAWQGSGSSSRYTALLLEVLANAMEYKIFKERDLEKEGYEVAFMKGQGLGTVVPMIQAPPEFAMSALSCLVTISQTYMENVEKILSLSVIQALLGLPFPESKPMKSHLAKTLQSPLARKHVARILAQCSQSQAFMDIIQRHSEQCIKELVRLAVQLWDDGVSSLESFGDIMNVFHFISKHRPDALSSNLREAEMLHMLMRLSKATSHPASSLASAILDTLKKDPNFKTALRPIRKQYEEGYDPERELKLRQQEASQMPRTSAVK